ncbi:PQQ-dependent sugar dehydrogenase [Nitrincola sp. MINF-07-Sa-05]|uniref:PQQ-dependent sugar dehydrogenase n=1 Tax=Nitrincola salilacus TaxID=3400273 RepID=UPI0039183A2C
MPLKPRYRSKRIFFVLACSLSVAVLAGAVLFDTKKTVRIDTQHYSLSLEIVADNLAHPWSIAFLPDGEVLVTERPGRLRRLVDDELLSEPVTGLPDVTASGQGGLLDLALHPEFADNRLLYFSYSDQTSAGMTTRVARARYESGQLQEVEPIFEALPRSSGGRHFAGRMVFDPDGYLYISVGDRGEMERAQNPSDHAGSIIRLNDDGSVPENNPFVDQSQVRDEIFTWGNRNPQGLTVHPQTGEVWSNEHGPRGGDEINLIRSGLNYGWPEVTHGINYTGFSITPHTELPGMESPLLHWTPSIAPSGIVFYTGSDFPLWQGQIFSGALRDKLISRVSVKETDEGYLLQEEERFLQEFGQRIRDIRQGPDGYLWLLTDENPGQIVRIKPAQ